MMKQVIPFIKEVDFEDGLGSIVSVSLEHDYLVDNADINGNFFVYGEYKKKLDWQIKMKWVKLSYWKNIYKRWRGIVEAYVFQRVVGRCEAINRNFELALEFLEWTIFS